MLLQYSLRDARCHTRFGTFATKVKSSATSAYQSLVMGGGEVSYRALPGQRRSAKASSWKVDPEVHRPLQRGPQCPESLAQKASADLKFIPGTCKQAAAAMTGTVMNMPARVRSASAHQA